MNPLHPCMFPNNGAFSPFPGCRGFPLLLSTPQYHARPGASRDSST